MRCFYHADRESVGICKSCQRGICQDCAVDIGKGIACKDRCEHDARQLVQVTDAAIRHQPANEFIVARMRRNRLASAILYLALGGCFVVAGLIEPRIKLIAFLGAAFVAFAIYILAQLPKLPQVPGEPKT